MISPARINKGFPGFPMRGNTPAFPDFRRMSALSKELWTPAEITTALWLDAEDSSTLIIDGSNNVSQWENKAVSGHVYEQASASYQPVYNSVGFNNKPVLQFAEADHFDAPGTGAVADNTFSVFTVAIPNRTMSIYFETTTGTQGVSGNCVLFTPGHGGAGGSAGFGLALATNQICTIEHANAHAPTPAVVANSTPVGAIYEAYTSSRQHYIRKDGSLLRAGRTTAKNPIQLNTDTSIGGGSGWGDFSGGVSEILMVFGEIAPEDRQKIEGYLAHKWGLEANLPSDHPYKTKAPYK
jgi:hypothetical protein